MFETHKSWEKQYFLSQEKDYKSWYCFQLTNNRPWFYVKFRYNDDSNPEYLFISEIEGLRNISEKSNLKVQEVYIVTSSEINKTIYSQMHLLESIYSACDANIRELRFHIYELVGGKKMAYPAENYTENLDEVNLLYTTLGNS